jgi:lipoprotein-anchoring transpeptidase ErfK/SrfK
VNLLKSILLCVSATGLLVSQQVESVANEVQNASDNPSAGVVKQEGEQATFTSPKTIASRLVIKVSERRVYVYQEDKVLTSYPIAVGKKGWETPLGDFKIITKILNPSWQSPWNGKIIPPGADNPLGDRWIGFWSDGKDTIGFHGTPAENTVGRAASHGCVRMRNADVRALFEMVELNTPVIVQN